MSNFFFPYKWDAEQPIPKSPVALGNLISPPKQIFDYLSVHQNLRAALHTHKIKNSDHFRTVMTDYLLSVVKDGQAEIKSAFMKLPHSAEQTMHSYVFLIDCVLSTIFCYTHWFFQQKPALYNRYKKPLRYSILAVGGYGRGELAPHSDVDLLFLVSHKNHPHVQAITESMLYILWNLKFKIGHAHRTIQECLQLGKKDYTIRTALLEQRYIVGDQELAKLLLMRLHRDVFRNTLPDFVDAKLKERTVRHQRYGQHRYLLEPNVKHSKGGLRDLQTLYWITKYRDHVQSIAELVNRGVFTEQERQKFEQARLFLSAVRCHLHLIAGYCVDQLTFDLQVIVSERMGFKNHSGRLAVEHFMQVYFRHVTHVGELIRVFLTALEEEHVKPAPLPLISLFKRRKKPERIAEHYVIVHNRLSIADKDTFLADKLNILRIFEQALKTGYLLHPEVMRLLSACLHLIDDDMRHNKDAQRIFIDLLIKHGNPERALRRMNELGVLSAFIPEFAPIVSMMQFNIYHSYTVDEHTIQCISMFADIEQGKYRKNFPIITKILKSNVNRLALYFALFLHDIGKGRPERHEILGATIAQNLCRRFKFTQTDSETIQWLVRYHLVMSDTAQKRDISDPQTTRDFAKIVKTTQRLDLLFILTVCDICGVGQGVWNNWKAVLLRQLYTQTQQLLESSAYTTTARRENQAKKSLRTALHDWPKASIDKEIERHGRAYWQSLPTSSHVILASLMLDVSTGQINFGIDIKPDTECDATRVCCTVVDHPGIFNRLAGAFAIAGANVIDVHSYTSKDGYAASVFWIQDSCGKPYKKERFAKLKTAIHEITEGNVIPRTILKQHNQANKSAGDFRFPTTITFDNTGSESYTIIEVDTRDRLGLLYDLTRVFFDMNISIVSAVIATYGAQVVDVFYVKTLFGLKIYEQSKQEAIKKRLQHAIESVSKAKQTSRATP